MSATDDSSAAVYIDDGVTSSLGRDHVVSRGALTRYNEIIPRGLPTTDCFLMSRDIQFDPRIHADSEKYRVVPGLANPAEQWVKDCSLTLVSVGERTPERSTWFVRHVAEAEEDQLLQLYWAPHQFPDGEPVFKPQVPGQEADDTVDGILPYGTPIHYMLPDMRKLQQEFSKFKLLYPDLLDREAGLGEVSSNEDSDDSDPPRKRQRNAPPQKRGMARVMKPSARSRSTIARSQSASARSKTSTTTLQCSNCPGALTTGSDSDICARCRSLAYWRILCRLLVRCSGAQYRVRLEMAKPHKDKAALAGELLGVNDVIPLWEDDIVNNKFNPNPLDQSVQGFRPVSWN